MTPDVEGQIAIALRTLLDGNGLSGVKIIGYEVQEHTYKIISFLTSISA